MSFRRLITMMLAVAMAFAPLGMPAMAEEAAPAADHAAMAAQGHCEQQQQPQQPAEHHSQADQSCCAAMCIAVVAPSGVTQLPAYHAGRERPGSDFDRHGFLSEIATPPPRFA